MTSLTERQKRTPAQQRARTSGGTVSPTPAAPTPAPVPNAPALAGSNGQAPTEAVFGDVAAARLELDRGLRRLLDTPIALRTVIDMEALAVIVARLPGPEQEMAIPRLQEVFKRVSTQTLKGMVAEAMIGPYLTDLDWLAATYPPTRRADEPVSPALITALLEVARQVVALGPLSRENIERYVRQRLHRLDDGWRLFRQALRQAEEERDGTGGAPPLTPEQREARLAELREQALPLLTANNSLVTIGEALRRAGWGGGLAPLLLMYVAATSRLLPLRRGTPPCHVQVNGAPGSGKSFGVDTVSALLPADAVIKYDAGSPRVMVYDPADYQHRLLVWSEADSIPGAHQDDEETNPAASMFRTLLQSGSATYKVPVKDRETGAWTIQTVTKRGPTAVLTTTVDRIAGSQLDSRFLALDLPDDPAQQRAALEKQALLHLHGAIPETDAAVLALQAYLQMRAPIDVVVPYVRALNAEMARSRVDARLLRDAGRMLVLIESVALLHMEQRERDGSDRVVATYDDYKMVAKLLDEMGTYETTVTGATPGVRRVINAVAALHPLRPSAAQVAAELGISPPAVHKHVKIALRNGWLENVAERQGRGCIARLDVGDPLPLRCGLPSVEQLQAWRPPRSPMGALPPKSGLSG
jgi:hypothetical protein